MAYKNWSNRKRKNIKRQQRKENDDETLPTVRKPGKRNGKKSANGFDDSGKSSVDSFYERAKQKMRQEQDANEFWCESQMDENQSDDDMREHDSPDCQDREQTGEESSERPEDDVESEENEIVMEDVFDEMRRADEAAEMAMNGNLVFEDSDSRDCPSKEYNPDMSHTPISIPERNEKDAENWNRSINRNKRAQSLDGISCPMQTLDQNRKRDPPHPWIRPRTYRESAPSPQPPAKRIPTPELAQKGMSEAYPLQNPSNYSGFIPAFNGNNLKSGSFGEKQVQNERPRTRSASVPDELKNRQLENIRLSCYVNSILQALSACRPFVENAVAFFKEVGWKMTRVEYRKSDMRFDAQVHMLRTILQIIVKLGTSKDDIETVIPFDEHPRIKKMDLEEIRSGAICKGFEANTHQDAQEVFGNMRTFFEDTFKRFGIVTSKYDPSRLMQAEIESVAYCESCAKYWNNGKTVDIHVNIQFEDSIDLLVNDWFLPKREDRDCPRCDERNSLYTRHRLVKKPEVLVVIVNRVVARHGVPVKVTHPIEASMTVEIVTCAQDFNDVLFDYENVGADLPSPRSVGNRKVSAADLKYELRSVVVHEGPLGVEGHYCAYTKDPKGSWVYCSDMYINFAEEEAMKKNMAQNGYMFFYTAVCPKQTATNAESC